MNKKIRNELLKEDIIYYINKPFRKIYNIIKKIYINHKNKNIIFKNKNKIYYKKIIKYIHMITMKNYIMQ